jgi:hypothetical protein
MNILEPWMEPARELASQLWEKLADDPDVIQMLAVRLRYEYGRGYHEGYNNGIDEVSRMDNESL